MSAPITASLTDSPLTHAEFDQPVFGIDTIDVGIPVTPDAFSALPQVTERSQRDRPGVARFAQGHLSNGTRIRVRREYDGPRALLSFSAPRRLSGTNCQPASFDQTAQSVRSVMSELTEDLEIEVDEQREVDLRRVDLARDFTNVATPHALLDDLSRQPVGRGLVTTTYRSQGNVGVQTVSRGPKGWRTQLYNRAHMYRDAAWRTRAGNRDQLLALADQTEGVVRFEAQLRRSALVSSGVRTLSDLEGVMENLGRRYWKRSGFEVSVGGGPTRLAAVRHGLRSGHSSGALATAIGHAVLANHGIPAVGAANTQRKYQGFLEEHRLTFLDIVPGEEDLVRLCLESGTVVVVDRRAGGMAT